MRRDPLQKSDRLTGRENVINFIARRKVVWKGARWLCFMQCDRYIPEQFGNFEPALETHLVM